MKVGYGAYSKDFSVPGDRRRFVQYVNDSKVDYEYADIRKDYDVVYITYNSDLRAWIDRKKKEGDQLKLIFELIDSYLDEPVGLKSKLRGLSRYLSGTASRPSLDFKNVLKEVCKVADAVVCSTNEQKQMISEFNDNVHISLDIFENDIESIKTEFRDNSKLKLVWEGQPYTLQNILSIKDVLNDFAEDIELNVVTDLHYYKYDKKYFKKSTLDLLAPLKCDKVLHKWEKHSFSQIITSCDLAIIPIDLSNSMQKGKPENKLVLLWKMGMPVLVSASPSYKRSMDLGGIDMYCIDQNDWRNGLSSYINSTINQRRIIGTKCQNFANEMYSKSRLINVWKEIFQSVLQQRHK